jgi:WD40 repeat protein
MPYIAAAALVLLGATTAASDHPSARLIAQLGHSAPIHATAYAPDGRFVATAGADATAVLWEAATGDELRTFAGHTAAIDALAFSPDGRFLATGSRDKTAKLWDVASGRELRTFPHGNGGIVAVAFSRDGTHVLTGGWDSSVTIWETATGEPVRTLTGFDKGISSIAVSPDGRLIATGSSDRTARLFDAASGALVRTLSGHTDTVSAVAFSPDSGLLATASWDHTVRLWSAADGRPLRTLAHHAAEVTSVGFSPDGRSVLSGSRDLTAILWNVESGKVRGIATGHTDWVSSVAFSPDGRWLLSASHDRTARRWDSRAEVQPLVYAGRSSAVAAIAYAPDGRSFATGGHDGVTTIWDASTGQPSRLLTGHEHWVTSLAYAPDGATLATASRDLTVRLWSTRTGVLLGTLRQHDAPVTSVVFSPDGRLLASRALDKSAIVWDAASMRPLHTFAPQKKPVDSLAFSPDGRSLLTGWNAAAQVWDVSTWESSKVIGPHTFDFDMNAVAFSPDGRLVLTASGDGTAKLWNAKSGAALRTLDPHAGAIHCALFSPDGRFILTGSSDGTVKVWDAVTGAETRAFRGHSGAVHAAAFSPDGRFALTAGADGTVRLAETDAGRSLATLVSFGAEGWAVVDADGRFDASNGGEVAGLHWVAGDEVIALHQLRSRYYDPFLLAKVVGTLNEPRKDVIAFDRVALGPEVSVARPSAESMRIAISLRNRGGGIGNVRVLVNRKELVDDACGTRRGATAESKQCVVDVADAPLLPGQENTIEVVAWNIDETVASRGVVVIRTPPAAQEHEPELYAIFVGISEYASPSLRLNYAAHDAEVMASAVELGARRLFGTQRVHVTRLITADTGARAPTRKNIESAFAAARRAAPEDVLLVYLSGHGTAIADDYVYPTRDATTLALNDSASRARDAVTGRDLAEWIRQIPALKQVMILDTCAAGAVAGRLERSERSSLARALERLSSRTGFHVLTGSAADAFSYESHGLGHGLLTYALLHGMKGAALREREYIDIMSLFQYAADEVPRLGSKADPVQHPQIYAPRGLSFDIGRLGIEERARIALREARPVVRPRRHLPRRGEARDRQPHRQERRENGRHVRPPA